MNIPLLLAWLLQYASYKNVVRMLLYAGIALTIHQLTGLSDHYVFTPYCKTAGRYPSIN